MCGRGVHKHRRHDQKHSMKIILASSQLVNKVEHFILIGLWYDSIS